MSLAADIYARQLFRLGYGYPLWFPEPNEDGEIEIGDVGYVEDGAFLRMFNITRKADDKIHEKHGVPDDFHDMKPNDWGRHKMENAIPAGPLTSISVKKVDFQAKAGAQGVGFSGTFHCAENQGALLILKDSATRERLPALRKVKNYMLKNIQNWYSFARDKLDLETREDEIWLIIGHSKTTQWAVSAITNGGKSAQLSVSGEFGLPINLSVAGEVTHAEAQNWLSRFGPQTKQQRQRLQQTWQQPGQRRQHNRRQRAPQQDRRSQQHTEPPEQQEAVDNEPLKENQCVFLHYLKMKRRLGIFPNVMKGAAEPQDLSTDQDDDDDLIEQVPNYRKLYDPVDFILDYILDNSQADVAIASDTELNLLCNGSEIPEDIPAYLLSKQPPIEVRSDGLGMLSLDDGAILPLIEDGDNIRVASSQQGGISSSGPARQDSSHLPLHTEHENPSSIIPGGQGVEASLGPTEGLKTPFDANGEQESVGLPKTDISSQQEKEKEISRRDDSLPDSSNDASDGLMVANPVPGSLLALPHTSNSGRICALACSPNGRYIAGGFEDSSVVIWNAASRQPIHELRDHDDAISALAFSKDSRTLVSGSRDKRLIIWIVATGEKEVVLEGHRGMVKAVEYSPDGKTVASASVDFTIRLWNVETGALRVRPCDHGAMVNYVAFSPDGTRIITASADCIARVWSTEDGSMLAELEGHEGVIYSISFSPDSRRVVTSSDDRSVRVWSAISGDLFVTMREHVGTVWSAIFSTDGTRVLSVANDKTIRICDSYTGELLTTIDGGSELAHGVTFSVDGKLVAAGGVDHSVYVWDTTTGRRKAQYPGHTDIVSVLQFSADSRRLVSASDDGTLHSWDITQGQATV